MSTCDLDDEDFQACARAAMDARDIGRADDAAPLDRLARTINAVLTRRATSPISLNRHQRPINWQDMPSVLRERA